MVVINGLSRIIVLADCEQNLSRRMVICKVGCPADENLTKCNSPHCMIRSNMWGQCCETQWDGTFMILYDTVILYHQGQIPVAQFKPWATSTLFCRLQNGTFEVGVERRVALCCHTCSSLGDKMWSIKVVSLAKRSQRTGFCANDCRDNDGRLPENCHCKNIQIIQNVTMQDIWRIKNSFHLVL